VVIGVVDDELGRLESWLLDHPRFPLVEASVVALPWSRRPDGPRASAAELAALDFVVVSTPVNAAEEFEALGELLADPGDLRVLGVHLDGAQRARFRDELVDDVVRRTLERPAVELGFQRDGPDRARLHVLGVDHGTGLRARFAVVSEPWSWYAGWGIEGLDPAPDLRVADGVSTAFLLPAEVPVSPLVAVYRPRSFRLGLVVGALGLLLALGLSLAPYRGA
jgi:hypothetical protein